VQVGRYLRFAFFEAMNILPSIFSFWQMWTSFEVDL
jgi:hypothetical protein